MTYWHEYEERQPNKHPLCTSLPPRSVQQNTLASYLVNRRLNLSVARANGWYESSDAGDGYCRVVIPAITHKTGHVYWQARDMTGQAFMRYQSSKGPRHEALIQVLPVTKSKGIAVVEGPMDALAAAGEGYISFALMGMQPNRATLMHLALLIESYKQLNTLVVLDRDSAQHAVQVATFLCSQGYFANIQLLPGPEKDLAECLPKTRARLLKESFRNSFRLRNCRQHPLNGQHA